MTYDIADNELRAIEVLMSASQQGLDGPDAQAKAHELVEWARGELERIGMGPITAN